MRAGFLLLLVTAFSTLPAAAQKAKAPLRVRTIRYASATPVLGLPGDASQLSGLCSGNGLTYFGGSAGDNSPGEIYTVTSSAEVKHLLRKLPVTYTEITLRGFYPAEHTLVSLLEARDKVQPGERPRESEYLLSTSDPGGDGADLLPLQLHFRPLKVAAFGSGEFLVLGMDTANRIPLLARLKTDGTVARFIDLGAMQRAGADAEAVETMASGAAFVPFGSGILLTFPGTREPLFRISERGDADPLRLDIPAGFTLQSVLGSEWRPNLVARVQSPALDKKPGMQRLLEFSSMTGELIQEFVLDEVPVAAVTCAAKQSLTSVWMRPKGSPEGEKAQEDGAKELVIGMVRR